MKLTTKRKLTKNMLKTFPMLLLLILLAACPHPMDYARGGDDGGGSDGSGSVYLTANADTFQVFAGMSAIVPMANIVANDDDSRDSSLTVVWVGTCVRGSAEIDGAYINLTSTGELG